ncbi:MAG: hypothetical protein LQ338_002736 [Usnochroma carphineum]|nr:MAG: hypothetical protein LQ338_002736 [Usnochroma carphineum]
MREVLDAAEESFLLFTQSLPSQNLGFIDPKASVLELEFAGRNLSIAQSPTLLSSDRKAGTTGAVVWKITPLFGEWIASPENLFLRNAVIHANSIIVELGCGVSGIVGLSLAPRVARYLLTDQEYVSKLLKQNIENNLTEVDVTKKRAPAAKKRSSGSNVRRTPNLEFLALDWETDSVQSVPALLANNKDTTKPGVDALLACDCIYNESLIAPFVRTCEDLCHLADPRSSENPTIIVTAQQLRSPEVFEAWLIAFMESFRVWRVPDALLSDELKESSGFVVHIGILQSSEQ